MQKGGSVCKRILFLMWLMDQMQQDISTANVWRRTCFLVSACFKPLGRPLEEKQPQSLTVCKRGFVWYLYSIFKAGAFRVQMSSEFGTFELNTSLFIENFKTTIIANKVRYMEKKNQSYKNKDSDNSSIN